MKILKNNSLQATLEHFNVEKMIINAEECSLDGYHFGRKEKRTFIVFENGKNSFLIEENKNVKLFHGGKWKSPNMLWKELYLNDYEQWDEVEYYKS